QRQNRRGRLPALAVRGRLDALALEADGARGGLRGRADCEVYGIDGFCAVDHGMNEVSLRSTPEGATERESHTGQEEPDRETGSEGRGRQFSEVHAERGSKVRATAGLRISSSAVR